LAEISDDAGLCDQFQIKGRSPKTVMRITAEEIYMHCGKAPMRAGFWNTETWPNERPIPSMYAMIKDHAEMEVASTEQSYAEERYRKTLY
jgi:predicted pyridoxine 5'-phosphate oxidase superfamily flavin-nucleotide-binding protein